MERRKISVFIYVFILALFLGIAHVQSNGIISDDNIIPPDYHTFKPPRQVGATYVDPAFSTVVKRVTNAGLLGPDVMGGNLGNSEISFFNIDGSYFIATENIEEGNITCFLYDGQTGARLKTIGTGTMRPWWIRWALADHYTKNGQTYRFEPKYHFYKYEGNELRLYDVRDLEYVVLHKFIEYNQIGSGGGEGDISDNGRYWCLDGNDRVLFVYDLVNDIKYPETNFNLGSLGSQGGNVGVDYSTVSPSGEYVVVAWGTDASEERYHGIEVYDKNWNFLRQIYPGIIHWEVGTDAFGHDVVYTVAGFGIPEYFLSRGVEPGDVISIRLSDGYMRLLKHMPKWSGQVMCANNTLNTPNYLYVAFYRLSADPNVAWGPFWGEIVEIPTDGSGEVRRFVHHRTRQVEGKSESYAQPDFIINRQGTKAVYRSVYTYSTGDLYMFDIASREAPQTDTTPPNPPTGLNSPNQTFDSIELSWNRPEQAEDGDYASSYQVWRDDELVIEIHATEYTDTGLEEATSYQYKIYALDKVGNQSDDPAFDTFSTLSDTIPPGLAYVRPKDIESITVCYTEPVEKFSAETTGNYEISDGINVLGAELQDDSICVTLTTDPLTLGVEYTLTVSGVRDLSANANEIPPGTQATFRLLSDYYEDFEDGVADGWQPLTPEMWNVTYDDGDNSYFLNSSDYENPGGMRLGEYTLLEDSEFMSCNFDLTCWAKSAENLVENNHADHAVIFAFQDSLNYCYVQLHSYNIVLCRIVDGEDVLFIHPSVDVPLAEYHKIGIHLENDTVKVAINDEHILESELAGLEPGLVGLGSFNDSAYFDDFNIEALGIKEPDLPPQPPSGVIIRP